jgi:hypothetical protein
METAEQLEGIGLEDRAASVNVVEAQRQLHEENIEQGLKKVAISERALSAIALANQLQLDIDTAVSA